MFINERGIYDTKSAYHDDIEYIWYVSFDDPFEKQKEDYQKLFDMLRKEGAKDLASQIRGLIGARSW